MSKKQKKEESIKTRKLQFVNIYFIKDIRLRRKKKLSKCVKKMKKESCLELNAIKNERKNVLGLDIKKLKFILYRDMMTIIK